jgi:hypothetical protein
VNSLVSRSTSRLRSTRTRVVVAATVLTSVAALAGCGSSAAVTAARASATTATGAGSTSLADASASTTAAATVVATTVAVSEAPTAAPTVAIDPATTAPTTPKPTTPRTTPKPTTTPASTAPPVPRFTKFSVQADPCPTTTVAPDASFSPPPAAELHVTVTWAVEGQFDSVYDAIDNADGPFTVDLPASGSATFLRDCTSSHTYFVVAVAGSSKLSRSKVVSPG